MLRELRKKWKKRRTERLRKKAIKMFRREMAFFGYDVSNMTDDEIEAGVMEMSRQLPQMGVTVEEATEAMQQMALLSAKYLPDCSYIQDRITIDP